MPRPLVACALLLAAMAAAPRAGAATAADPMVALGKSAVTIIATPMSVGSAAPGSPQGAAPLGATMSSTQVTVTGDPGQLYRVAAAAPAGYRVSFWSANTGDVSASRTGRLSAQGRDTLRIAFTPASPIGAPVAAPPALTVMISGE